MRGAVTSERCILHVDMDAFFAAIEQRDHPEWRGKPVVVGGDPHARGVVSTASYEARTFGIHSAMPLREAFRRCPHAIFTPVDGPRYQAVSHAIFAIFNRYTPLVEGLSCDEAFLDVTGSRTLFGDGETIARRIRADIVRELRLTASVGVAPNKFLAKIASELQKPDGLTVMPADPAAIAERLAPMPATRIFGIGRQTAEALSRAGIHSIGDIRKSPPHTLVRLLGETGAAHLRALAHGIDDRPVEPDREEKSISREHTFAEDASDPAVVRARLLELAADVARRTREAGRFATTGRLKLRWSDFTTRIRQTGFDTPACDDFTFRETAGRLFDSNHIRGRAVRLVGFGVTGLTTERVEPQTLFPEEEVETRDKRERASRALDEIRRRQGHASIGFAGDPRARPT